MESCVYRCRRGILSSLSQALTANGFRTRVTVNSDNWIDEIIVGRCLNAVRVISYDCESDESTHSFEDEEVMLFIPVDIMRFVWLRFSNLGLAADVEELMLSIPDGNVRRTNTGLIREWLVVRGHNA
jgi:hypothetical protein